MRATFIVAALLGVATAVRTITVTQTTDITVTACAPTKTDCGAKATDAWNNWSAPAPQPTGHCPAYTGTGIPDWYSQLPDDVMSSMADKWATGVPSDWCDYSYSATSTKTSVIPYYPTGKPTGNPVTTTVATGGYYPTSTKAYATYTGAASHNAGSMAIAGLAAAAAIALV